MEEYRYLNPLAVVFLVCFSSLLLTRKLFSNAQSKLNLPPSPRALPVIGHLHLLRPIPHQALHKISTRLGPLVHFRLGSLPCVMAADADTAREFLKTYEPFFSNRPHNKVVSSLTYGTGGFLFAPYGDYWRFVRKLCVSELLGSRSLEGLRWIRREEMGRFIRNLHEKAEEREEVDVGAELLGLSNNVMCRMVMSKRCSGTDGEAFEVKNLMEESSELMMKFNVADLLGFCRNLDPQGLQRRAEDVQRRFDRMMEGILQEREDLRGKRDETTCREKRGGRVKDLLDILLDTAQDEGADQMKMTRQSIKVVVRDIFGAGTDTVALTMAWAVAELINHPAVLQKAREEVDSVVGESRLVDESDMPSLPFLQAIIKETLRLHPAIPLIIRQSTRHCRIMGYDIPANTKLFINLWAMGRDPKQWEDPLDFCPERFMEKGRSAGVDVRGQHFQFLPFASGRRGCPGISLAMQVMLPTIGAMIQCFKLSVDEGVVDMGEGAGLTLLKAHPLVCTLMPRLNPLPLL